jgi:CDP-4-dehydro-6-deoxyglucose reductase, E1
MLRTLDMDAAGLRAEVARLVRSLHELEHAPRPFLAGISPVPVNGRVYDAREISMLVDASLDFWLTTGPYAERFERRLAEFVGVRHAILCNSGSSANLLAVSALTSRTLGDRALRPGDEVITVAAGFPTTVNPVIQNQLVPVFVDVDVTTLNVDCDLLETARTGRTRAVILAHTLGNPFNVDAVTQFCKRHGLWLIEDNCDALGSTYGTRKTGTFGDLATLSFYPAHHVTTGEGGAVLTSSPLLKKLVESFRDWGRDCWCAPGEANTCGKRYEWQLGELPYGYDHKYVYGEVGYNLKMTDLQAAVGLAQMDKVESFVARRVDNWNFFRKELAGLDEHLALPEPETLSRPSWFGFSMGVRSAAYSRRELVRFLDGRKIQSRFVFAGNMTRQPAMVGRSWRAATVLPRSDEVMERYFWIGVYPGITDEMRGYVVEAIREFHQAL